jgi:hypothetical protein
LGISQRNFKKVWCHCMKFLFFWILYLKLNGIKVIWLCDLLFVVLGWRLWLRLITLKKHVVLIVLD